MLTLWIVVVAYENDGPEDVPFIYNFWAEDSEQAKEQYVDARLDDPEDVRWTSFHNTHIPFYMYKRGGY